MVRVTTSELQRARVLRASLLGLALLVVTTSSRAATIDWKGHTWNVTSGGMAGVCDGDPANVSVDADGYLHLRISHDGGTWSAAELFTNDKLGFGTYLWYIDGPIDKFDANVVLGLFPYGPAAGIGTDGTNEIDIEYSRWGQANGPNGDYTDYPATGVNIGEKSFTFSLMSSLSTSRFVWSSTSITDSLFDSLVPILRTGASLQTWTYMPAQPATNIPQQALPLGMNLWCFDSPPSDNNPVEVVIRDFQFLAEGDATGAAGSGANDGGAAGSGPELGGSGGHATAGTGTGGSGAGVAGRGDQGAGATGRSGGGQGTGAAGASTNGGRTGAGGVSGVPPTGGGGASTGASATSGVSGTSARGPAGAAGLHNSDSGITPQSRSSSGCGCRLVSALNAPTGGANATWLLLTALVLRRRSRFAAFR
jgi:hypothetical protein